MARLNRRERERRLPRTNDDLGVIREIYILSNGGVIFRAKNSYPLLPPLRRR